MLRAHDRDVHHREETAGPYFGAEFLGRRYPPDRLVCLSHPELETFAVGNFSGHSSIRSSPMVSFKASGHCW